MSWFFDGDFFSQAEDGIRAKLVTGVQTCALPISNRRRCLPVATSQRRRVPSSPAVAMWRPSGAKTEAAMSFAWGARVSRSWPRSEERRVGKECRSRGSPGHLTEKTNKWRREVDAE